jgi:hypothetical protein
MPWYESDETLRSIVLPVAAPAVEPDVLEQLQSDGFRLKDDFHITVVPSETGQDLRENEFGIVSRLLGGLALPKYRYTGQAYEISKPKRDADGAEHPRCAVVLPVISDEIMNQLYTAGQAAYHPMHDVFLHVTLATRPDTAVAGRGIGIANLAQWRQLAPRTYAEQWQP